MRIFRITLWFGIASIAAAAETRTWTDVTGQHRRQGSFETLTNGHAIVRPAGGGRSLELPLDRLSDSDLRYLLRIPEIRDATFEKCHRKFAFEKNGDPAHLPHPPQRLEASINRPLGNFMYLIKSDNLGHIALELPDTKFGPGKWLGRLIIARVPQSELGGKRKYPVYRVVRPLKPADLPDFVAKHRDSLIPFIGLPEKEPAEVAQPDPKPDPPANPDADPERPVDAAFPAAAVAYAAASAGRLAPPPENPPPPIGAHFLDSPAAQERYQILRAKGLEIDEIRDLTFAESRLRHLSRIRDRNSRWLDAMAADDPRRQDAQDRIRQHDDRIDELRRQAKKLHRLLGD